MKLPRLLTITAATFLFAGLFLHSALGEQRSGLLSLRLEANKSVYHLGETIELRLTVQSTTAQTYYVEDVAPWGMSKLVVKDGGGDVVAPKTFALGSREGPSNYFRKITPGMTFIANYRDPDDYSAVKEWAKIDYWGYRVSEPGKYAISAIPTISGFEQNGPSFTTSSRDSSNAVQIDVLK